MAHKELHIRKKEKSHSPAVRPWLTAFLLSLLVCASVLGTAAYMRAQSHVGNAFTMAELSVEVEETFENNIKENVTVKNTGDVPAYLRAAIVVCWKDNSGNILSDTPALGTDYTMMMGEGWTKGSDGYWYCTAPVAAKAASPILIDKCEPTAATADKSLCVDILAQGVQAEPSEAVNTLWGASVDENGKLTPASEGGTTP